MTKTLPLFEKAKRITVTEEKLTTKQEEWWDQSRTRFMWEAPGSSTR
jgi:hypothetical protein